MATGYQPQIDPGIARALAQISQSAAAQQPQQQTRDQWMQDYQGQLGENYAATSATRDSEVNANYERTKRNRRFGPYQNDREFDAMAALAAQVPKKKPKANRQLNSKDMALATANLEALRRQPGSRSRSRLSSDQLAVNAAEYQKRNKAELATRRKNRVRAKELRALKRQMGLGYNDLVIRQEDPLQGPEYRLAMAAQNDKREYMQGMIENQGARIQGEGDQYSQLNKFRERQLAGSQAGRKQAYELQKAGQEARLEMQTAQTADKKIMAEAKLGQIQAAIKQMQTESEMAKTRFERELAPQEQMIADAFSQRGPEAMAQYEQGLTGQQVAERLGQLNSIEKRSLLAEAKGKPSRLMKNMKRMGYTASQIKKEFPELFSPQAMPKRRRTPGLLEELTGTRINFGLYEPPTR